MEAQPLPAKHVQCVLDKATEHRFSSWEFHKGEVQADVTLEYLVLDDDV